MSDKTLTPTTPREVRLCRDAFESGVLWRESGVREDGLPAMRHALRRIVTEAAAWRYVMPMVEVPRVVKADGCEYRLHNGALQYLAADGVWYTGLAASVVLAVATLHANPTERKSADEVEP